MSKVNQAFLSFMKQEFNTVIEDYFSPETFPELNKQIKKNYYALDAIGLPIRLKDRGRKTMFGWRREGDLFLHYTVNLSDLDDPAMNPERLRDIMITRLRASNPSLFTKPDSAFRKTLRKQYGNRYEQ